MRRVDVATNLSVCDNGNYMQMTLPENNPLADNSFNSAAA